MKDSTKSIFHSSGKSFTSWDFDFLNQNSSSSFLKNGNYSLLINVGQDSSIISAMTSIGLEENMATNDMFLLYTLHRINCNRLTVHNYNLYQPFSF